MVIVILAIVVAVSRMPVEENESGQFATPAFQSIWLNEASAATRAVDLWGGEPLASRIEPFIGAPNNRRVVQYFERGRMEVESGADDVTQGKLAQELVTGSIDLGGDVTIKRQPPGFAIDSGEPDDRIPTWRTLSGIVSSDSVDPQAPGDQITRWIGRNGPYERDDTPEVRYLELYIEESGYFIPDVTAELFNRPEFQDERWVESFGYPISEPYWSHYRRQGQTHEALIQVFERRVLVYTPRGESSRAFTVPSIGRHYALWRYGSDATTEPSWPPDDAQQSEITPGDGLEAWVYAEDIGTPVDLALSASGHLMILTMEGEILIAESLDPDGTPSGFEVWASGIEDPQGLTTIGETVVVTASAHFTFFADRDGAGIRVDSELSVLEPGESGNQTAHGKPVRNSAGAVFGRIESSRGRQVLREIGESEETIDLHEYVVEPGPIGFTGVDLLLAGRQRDDRNSVLLFPSFTTAEPASEPRSIGSFPQDMQIRAIAVADEEHWQISESGEVLVAVQQDHTAQLFALSRTPRGNAAPEVEAIQLASGLSRPTAIEIGLDGSIYVADAETGRIIRITHTGS